MKVSPLVSISGLLLSFLLAITTFASNCYEVSGFLPQNPLAYNSTKKITNLLKLEAFTDAETAQKTSITLNSVAGGLTFAGGVMGFVTKGSNASLIAGSTFGGLLLVSAFLTSQKKLIGNVLGTGVSGMLTYTMGKKFLKSGKFMPAGLIAGLGIASFIFNFLGTVLKKEDGDDTSAAAEDSGETVAIDSDDDDLSKTQMYQG